jgi:hypothetical protein
MPQRNLRVVGQPEVGPKRYLHKLQLYLSFLARAAILWFKERLSASARALQLK